MSGRADRSGPFAERRRNDRHAVMVGPPLDAIEFAGERHEQRVFRLGNAAAEHDELGIEEMNARAESACECPNRFEPDPRRIGVAGYMRRDQCGRARESALTAITDRAVADHDFNGTGHSGDAHGALWIETQMAN